MLTDRWWRLTMGDHSLTETTEMWGHCRYLPWPLGSNGFLQKQLKWFSYRFWYWQLDPNKQTRLETTWLGHSNSWIYESDSYCMVVRARLAGLDQVLTCGWCGNDGHEVRTSQAVEYQAIPSHKCCLVLIFGLNTPSIRESFWGGANLTSWNALK